MHEQLSADVFGDARIASSKIPNVTTIEPTCRNVTRIASVILVYVDTTLGGRRQ